MKKKIIVLCMMFLCILLMNGCTTKKIFVSEEDKYKLIPYTDSELENDIFYIKDGSKFYKPYKPDGTVTGITQQFNAERIFWMTKDMSLIPTLYKDEIIAYASKKVGELTEVNVERFYDIGYSLGIYGGTIDSDGYYSFKVKKNTISNSSAYEAFKGYGDSDIRIVAINDTPVTSSMFNDSGIFVDAEQNKSYEIGFYAGTYYQTAIVEADYYYMASYETYFLEEIKITKNGYVSIKMPEYAKSGYYLIEGQGLIKYYNYEKGDNTDNEQNMNEAYYNEDMNENDAYSQQYTVSVGTKTSNVNFKIEYDTSVYTDDKIVCKLTAPNGTEYEMKAEEGIAQVEISEVMAGYWKIIIYPKNLVVNNVNATPTTQTAEAIQEVFEFDITEEQSGTVFYVQYEGEGDVWGTVVNEEGSSKTLDGKKGELTTSYDYLPVGHYIMTVYHYIDTTITDYGYRIDENKITDEIISIEE